MLDEEAAALADLMFRIGVDSNVLAKACLTVLSNLVGQSPCDEAAREAGILHCCEDLRSGVAQVRSFLERRH